VGLLFWRVSNLAHRAVRHRHQLIPISIQEVTNVIAPENDIYQGPSEKADRKHPRLVLALFCTWLALVVANAIFGAAPDESLLVGP
jgi:hypothetical protein